MGRRLDAAQCFPHRSVVCRSFVIQSPDLPLLILSPYFLFWPCGRRADEINSDGGRERDEIFRAREAEFV